LIFEIFFFKVEISSHFAYLKKSYLHKLSMSSPSPPQAKKRLLYLSKGSRTCRRNFYVQFSLQLLLKKKVLLPFDSKIGRSFKTRKNTLHWGKKNKKIALK
jgi:hypothetical protein